ncbi:hypothetical protein [Pseudactinotalea suaedae]|uniref:hypothetical protein n=1 Tax=Pseudactinotalea suaedae TaxID=1524924 RepID=UPI0012E23D64|nr:hypothetical protein [Pseudactinotalea suaedae]
MRTLTELWTLARDTAALWWCTYPRLLLWFCVGFGVHHLGQQASAVVGSAHQLLATMLFVLGVLGWLACLVMMLHSVKQAPWTPQHLEPGAALDHVPHPLVTRERGMDVLALALGPFLAVYSVWGLVEDEVSDLFFANISREGLTEPDSWSISFAPERLGFYAALTVGAWLTGKLITLLRARVRARDGVQLGLRIVSIVADGTAVFGLFVALGIGAGQVRDWWQGRMVSVWIGQAWRGVLDRLPDWQLWFGESLPDALRGAVTWFWTTLLPATSERVLLPLMWLALAATVFGWRELRGRDVLAGTRLEAAAGRLDSVTGRTGVQAGAVPTLIALATDDLRHKYLPVANALRLVWRAGPRFVGVYLVLATVLWAGEVWASEGLVRLAGPQPDDVTFALEPFFALVLGAVFLTASVALYAAAFDRAVVKVAGVRQGSGRALDDGPTAEPPQPVNRTIPPS